MLNIEASKGPRFPLVGLALVQLDVYSFIKNAEMRQEPGLTDAWKSWPASLPVTGIMQQLLPIACLGLAILVLTVMVLLVAPKDALRFGSRGWHGEWLFAVVIVGLIVLSMLSGLTQVR